MPKSGFLMSRLILLLSKSGSKIAVQDGVIFLTNASRNVDTFCILIHKDHESKSRAYRNGHIRQCHIVRSMNQSYGVFCLDVWFVETRERTPSINRLEL